jgi:SAM-dependent methyltransferase
MVDTTADPFGRALRDHHRGEREAPLIVRDGSETREHPIEEFYFGERDPDAAATAWLDDWLVRDGPLVDLGAGVGSDALYYGERVETVAVEVSPALVETMRERGVADAREGDMFDLRASFDRDRFAAALVRGTQLGLAGSLSGIRRFLGELAAVVRPGGAAVVDSYDPSTGGEPTGAEATDGATGDHDGEPDGRDGGEDGEGGGPGNLLGYRSHPAPGLAGRAFHFEYEGEVGRTLVFRLLSPDRLREACVGTGWRVAAVHRAPGAASGYYRAALRRQA